MSRDMLGSALAQVAGPLKDLLDKLGGSEGEMWLKALKRFLRKQNPWSAGEMTVEPPHQIIPFPIRTIRIGGKSAEQLLAEIDAAEMHFEDRCREMMLSTQFTTEPRQRDIRLVETSTRQLGFAGPAHTKIICEVARLRGLVPCPIEVGPHLLLQKSDDSWMTIVSKSFRSQSHHSNLCRVGLKMMQCSEERHGQGYRGHKLNDILVFTLADDASVG